MKVKSTGSPGWAGGTGQPKPQRILPPSPNLCSVATGTAWQSSGSALAKWEPGEAGRTPHTQYPLPPLPLTLPVPLSGQHWWGGSLPPGGRPWPPWASRHWWQRCRVRSTETPCLDLELRVHFCKGRYELCLDRAGPTGWNGFFGTAEVRTALSGWPESVLRTLFLGEKSL